MTYAEKLDESRHHWEDSAKFAQYLNDWNVIEVWSRPVIAGIRCLSLQDLIGREHTMPIPPNWEIL